VIKRKNQKGATLIGVLVGITVLSIALTSQLKLLAVTMKRETELRNRIIATNLAREGIEIGVLMRNYWGWDENGSDGIQDRIDDNICTDYRLPNLDSKVSLASTCEDNIKFLGNFFRYTTSGEHAADVFEFRRTINFTECDAEVDDTGECLEIHSKVEWSSGDELELTKRIFNWYTP